mmetsp:Transcript_37634/g.68081  ORF Transcript_37634/g.68081 Transcript_37634/m.68081 type:complete len:270 (-) Transcript_37634:1222-2031(-)
MLWWVAFPDLKATTDWNCLVQIQARQLHRLKRPLFLMLALILASPSQRRLDVTRWYEEAPLAHRTSLVILLVTVCTAFALRHQAAIPSTHADPTLIPTFECSLQVGIGDKLLPVTTAGLARLAQCFLYGLLQVSVTMLWWMATPAVRDTTSWTFDVQASLPPRPHHMDHIHHTGRIRHMDHPHRMDHIRRMATPQALTQVLIRTGAKSCTGDFTLRKSCTGLVRTSTGSETIPSMFTPSPTCDLRAAQWRLAQKWQRLHCLSLSCNVSM